MKGDHIQFANNTDAGDALPASSVGLQSQSTIVSWNMRGNKDDRLSLFLQRLPYAPDILLLQETHMHPNALRQLSHSRYMTFRCDTCVDEGDDGDSSSPDKQRVIRGKHGVAILIRNTCVFPGTAPVIVCARDARYIVVDYVDQLGERRRVASIYFPAKGKRERLQFMSALPWLVLSTAIIGCDSNLRTSCIDKYPLRNGRVRGDGREFLTLIQRHSLVDLWDIDELHPATFAPRGVDTSCIDRVLLSSTLLHSSTVVHIAADANFNDLSDHKPIIVTLGSFAHNTLPRIRRRVPTAILLSDKAVLTRARGVASAAVSRLGSISPVIIWRETIDRISRMLYDANDAQIESRRRIRYSNLKRKRRFISMRIVCLEAELADAIAATTAGGAPLPAFDLARVSRERASLAIAARRVQASISMLDKRLHDDMHREADTLRFDSVPSNAGRIARALREADDAPARITVARRDPGSPLLSKPEEVNEVMTDFWANLRSTPVTVDDDAMRDVLSCITPCERSADMLSADLDLGDIDAAIKRAHVSAPGCDRMDIILFKMIPELAKLLHVIWQDRMQHGIPEEWRRSYVTLLPKTGAADPALAGSYRPITVECVAYRLICSAIQAKNAIWFDSMINDEQRAFVRCFNDDDDRSSSRNIFDGIAEVLGAVNNATRYNHPLACLLFDFKKAYDTISRTYVLESLRALGCNDKFVNDVAFIFRGCVSQIVINGHVGREFAISTGVAQGSPISCFLYIAAVSAIPALARGLGVAGYRPTLPPSSLLCLRRGQPVLLANQFVDNLVAYASSARDVELWFEAMARFGRATGQICNQTATRIVCVAADAQHLVPASRRDLVVTGDESVRLLGVYIGGSGTVHSDTWERRLAAMQVRLRKLDRLREMRDLRSRATAVRVFVLPTLLYVASVVAIPDDAVTQTQQMMTAFIFSDSSIHPSVDVVAEAAADGGLTANGGAARVDLLIRALVARRFQAFLCDRTRMFDDWLWLDAQQEYQQRYHTLWSPMSSPPRVFDAEACYNPNAYAHSQATRERIWQSRAHESLSAKSLILEPVAGNARFGARLRAGDRRFPRVSVFHRTNGRLVFMRPRVRDDALLSGWQGLLGAWPELAAELARGVASLANVAVDQCVSLRLDDASSSISHLHDSVGRVEAITHAGEFCSIRLFRRQPWSPEHGPLLINSLGDPMALVVSVPASACHVLVPSESGDRLFRSDDRDFDHRRLRIPHDTTSSDVETTLAVTAIAGRSALDHWRRDGVRFSREVACLSVPRRHIAVTAASAADLFHRVRSLSRSRGHALHMVERAGNRLSFADLLLVPFPSPVFDFAWRLLHRALPFQSWMRLPSVGVVSVLVPAERLAACPDCGSELDPDDVASRDSLPNDHVVLDCPGGLVSAVREALSAWLQPILTGPGLVDAFDRAWMWELRPSRRRAASLVAIMVAAIAKYRVWLHFTSRVFGDSNDPFRMCKGMPMSLGVEAELFLVKECKRDLRSFLRRLERQRPSVFNPIGRVVGPLWADADAVS